MNRIWVIFILLAGFVIYAYFGFGIEQVISNIVPQNTNRKEINSESAPTKDDAVVNTKSTVLPVEKATSAEPQPLLGNKSQSQ